MSRYLSILAVQRPFPIGVDQNGRVQFSCNYGAMAAAPVTDWVEEVVRLIIDSGAGTALGTDIFVGPDSKLPTGSGPYFVIIDTGGSEPASIHNAALHSYESLSCQIVVVHEDYETAESNALTVWRQIDGTYNTTVVA